MDAVLPATKLSYRKSVAGHFFQIDLQESVVDLVFILIIVGLYAATHWLIWALSRLGGVE